MKYDVAIIGGGPGGYTAAQKAADAGLSVIIFERTQLGGSCMNRGCIPTKALLHTAEIYNSRYHIRELGLQMPEMKIDFEAIQERKNRVVLSLRRGVEQLLNSKKVDVVYSSAQITGPHEITCNWEKYDLLFANIIDYLTGKI